MAEVGEHETMKKDTFRYVLRYKIDPLFNPDERVEELLRFCDEGNVEEVMLFMLAEELTTGHATLEELRPYVEMAKGLKARLNEQGVDLSLNPWTTLYHESRGRRLRPGRGFTLMVGETGAVSPIVACPLCAKWRKYMCETFDYLARELKPVAIWVEDDWRLHNHGPELGWGGCFCGLHLERLAGKVGREVGREELLEKILAPGRPHAWRKIWFEICRDSLLEPAVMLRETVRKANPSTRLGLMSSLPDVHSIEGRDWPVLQKALGDEPTFLCRPHMPPYTEERAISVPPSATRQTIANLEGPLEVYPELENSPRSGPYSKSRAYSLWQCFNAAALGSAGITINHFDMMGNGIALDREFAKGLAGAKRRLGVLAGLGLDDRKAEGVRVLFSPEVAGHRHSTSGSSLNGLHNAGRIWSEAFYVLGIAHCFSKRIEADGTPYAVNAQTLRAFDDRSIEELLSGPVILDACSIEILVERGFGSWIGVESAQWSTFADVLHAYESIEEADGSVFGLANPRMTAQRCASRVLNLRPADGVRVCSWLHSPSHERLFPGAISFTNPAGGRVVSLAYPLEGQGQFFMAFFNAFRRIMLQRMLFEMAPGAPLAAAEEQPMHVYRGRASEGTLFAAFNVVQDRAERLVLRVPKGQVSREKLRILTADNKWQPVKAEVLADETTERIIIEKQIGPLEGLFLLAD